MVKISTWVVCAGLMVMLVLMVFDSAEETADTQLPSELADAPNLLMATATILQYREDGTLNYRLAASQIRHFDTENVTRLRDASLHLIDSEGKAPWDIRARSGEIRQHLTPDQPPEEVVFLQDQVEMTQENPDGSFVRLQTPSIYYYSERQYAETAQNVMIDTDVGRTKAIGLQGELQQGLLRLFSSDEERVHTIVLPNQFR
jgi:LPS export ABC transporter protein LptC